MPINSLFRELVLLKALSVLILATILLFCIASCQYIRKVKPISSNEDAMLGKEIKVDTLESFLFSDTTLVITLSMRYDINDHIEFQNNVRNRFGIFNDEYGIYGIKDSLEIMLSSDSSEFHMIGTCNSICPDVSVILMRDRYFFKLDSSGVLDNSISIRVGKNMKDVIESLSVLYKKDFGVVTEEALTNGASIRIVEINLRTYINELDEFATIVSNLRFGSGADGKIDGIYYDCKCYGW
jgi:hypothetical protein